MNAQEAWKVYLKTFLELGKIPTPQEAFTHAWNHAISAPNEHEPSLPPVLVDETPYTAILDACNEILGKQFKATIMHKKHIKARWQEGYTIEDFKTVCKVKYAQWDSDPNMRIYLRPETLFGNKFDSYLNTEVKAQRTLEPDWL